MAQPNADVPTVSAVNIKLPPFWTADPELWFLQVESQFTARHITADLTKYHHVVSSLPPTTASEIRDLLFAPPANDAYGTLKRTLIRRVTPSEPQRLQQLLREADLGDRTPSQLLRQMQQLLGSTASGLDSLLLREIFLQRLPTSVRMVVISTGEKDLLKLAELADALMAVATPSVAAVQAEPTQPDQLHEIRAEISRLASTVAALQASGSHAPGRSATPRPQQTQKVCWYHRKYGNAARNCVPPC
ncbi:unnamed protein product, partial [Ixodes hexagonus]